MRTKTEILEKIFVSALLQNSSAFWNGRFVDPVIFGHSDVNPCLALTFLDKDEFCQMLVLVIVVGWYGEFEVEDHGFGVLTFDDQAFRSKISVAKLVLGLEYWNNRSWFGVLIIRRPKKTLPMQLELKLPRNGPFAEYLRDVWKPSTLGSCYRAGALAL